jgi:UDP-N-acetyl-D-glucosamine dehydrogenase
VLALAARRRTRPKREEGTPMTLLLPDAPPVTAALEEKIRSRQARVAIVGLGYVGLPLAAAFAHRGFRVCGIDLDPERAARIMAGSSYIEDLSDAELQEPLAAGRLTATTDVSVLRDMDVVILCVPTPYTKAKQPDLTYVVRAGQDLQRFLHPGMLVILESTTYPGTTQELLLPLLEQGGLRCGTDFHLAYSPERVDPGNKSFGLKNTPKIVGGVTQEATELAAALYGQVADRVVRVSNPRVAEMAKLLENTFRHVNIALVNEMAILCGKLGIDIWEVIDAAASKPFGFMPFYPGPGVGGHCIPIDPYYFAWKVQEEEAQARFIQLAGEINDRMPEFVVERVGDALNERGQSVRGSRVLVLGVSYKKDVGDVRESPAIKVIDRLQRKGAEVTYHDPFVERLDHGGLSLKSTPLTPESIAAADCVLILTQHECLPWKKVVEKAKVILDTRNALKEFKKENIVRL